MSAPALVRVYPRPCLACRATLHGFRPGGSRTYRHFGRGLCKACHDRHSRLGTLDRFPPTNWPADDLARDAEILRQRDPALTWPQVADRLGVSFAALDQARVRVRRRQRTGAGQ